MNPIYILEELKTLEQGAFDLISEVKQRYDFTNIELDEALDILFNLQSAITTAKEYAEATINVLDELEASYQLQMLLDADPITNSERGYIKWRR